MNTTTPHYHRHRVPSEIISPAIGLSPRCCMSFRDVAERVAARGVTVTDKTVRQRCQKFGPADARNLKKRYGRLGDTWSLDEGFVTLQGTPPSLWRAIDHDGTTIDMFVQRRRTIETAVRFFRQLRKGHGREPRWMLPDTLKRYAALLNRSVGPLKRRKGNHEALSYRVPLIIGIGRLRLLQR